LGSSNKPLQHQPSCNDIYPKCELGSPDKFQKFLGTGPHLGSKILMHTHNKSRPSSSLLAADWGMQMKLKATQTGLDAKANMANKLKVMQFNTCPMQQIHAVKSILQVSC
jgi:hypothetical protein